MKKKYEYVGSFYNGFADVRLNNKWGMIDETGKEVVELKYDNIGRFYFNDFIRIKLNDKWGIIDGKTGKQIIECKYDWVQSNFKNGFFKVVLNDEYFWINKDETIKIKEINCI